MRAPTTPVPSTATLLRAEAAKTRRLHLPLIVVVCVGVIYLLTLPLRASDRARLDDPGIWLSLLMGYTIINGLISPILIAFVSSRLVDVEHAGRGWTLHATQGVGAGRLMRIKLTILALLLASAVTAQSLVFVGLVKALGCSQPLDAGLWAGYTATLIAVDLALAALHVLLAGAVDNQVVCVGIGFIGSLAAFYMFLFPSAVARLLPWGYWAMISRTSMSPSGDGSIVLVDPDWAWIAGYLLLCAVVFAVACARFDRKQVTA
ncbi:ABC transporter permease [Actinomyces sp. B33]|uniref:ABC transporter permease n=1 Tax=Actinomyces sp. B33 TaxID=2942131 RepID=UPI0023425820|nr:ABC transporter permease [Actinomyces sp. B33]MDC4232697.1 ABC transporter permease [Actinomyces sp. B33]